MSKCCCKYAKWFPHNWLCLKGLSFLFVGFFYIAIGFAIYQAIAIFTYPAFSREEMWAMAAVYVLGDLMAAVAFLTIAKVLGALRKIKEAVAPCGCAHNEQPAQEEKQEPAAKETK